MKKTIPSLQASPTANLPRPIFYSRARLSLFPPLRTPATLAKKADARKGEGTTCKDAIVFFVVFVHQTKVKILIGQI